MDPIEITSELHLKTSSLNLWETLALSVAMMGPSASVSITVMMMAMFVGFSAPLMFIISMISVGLVAFSIVKLNRHFPSAGSVYYFLEQTLSKRAGFLSGWLVVFAYLMLGISCAAVACINLNQLFDGMGWHVHWFFIALCLLLLVWFLAHLSVQTGTRTLLLLEGFTVTILLALSVLIIYKCRTTGPLSLAPFTLNSVPPGGLALGLVFGFLAFSGFEGASSLGEESKHPEKMIPLAITCGIVMTGLFYIFVSYAQIIGFGVSPKGLELLTKNGTPLASLAQIYVGDWLSAFVLICIAISFFSATLGCLQAGARVLYTMGRDGMLPSVLNRVHPLRQTPVVGLNLLSAITLVLMGGGLLMGVQALGRYTAIIATLALLLVYIQTTFGALIYFGRKRIWRGPDFLMPLLSVIILSTIFVLNIVPVPEYPLNLMPFVVLGWILIGLVVEKWRVGPPR